ncbi:LptA/OstA family protein [Consotaella salsifontis]|uniref:Lipopolysaccharide export system protein LptA n=1 Tax=Consotaella salsifontis TaxID=1365950 RepID=A0A1T4QH05_9HYPH|nr:LptA/OstA family protein [Consotaella salsifontis]SKA02999.1 lipopolysaccharide export system protein LptA [Consotaella salsifontis]
MTKLLSAMLIAGALALPASTIGAGAQGFGNTFGGLQMSQDQPIAIESNQLDVNDADAMAVFTGNVQVTQGETLLKTGKLVVHYAKQAAGGDSADGKAKPAAASLPGGGGEIEKLEASENVYIKSNDQVATAQQATFDMTTQLAVMTGDVVLTQGDNVAAGCRLTIHMDTSVARLESGNCGGAKGEGRVRVMLTTKQKPEGQQ